MNTSYIKDIATERQKSQNYFRIIFKVKDWKSLYPKGDESNINDNGFIWSRDIWCYNTGIKRDKDDNVTGVIYTKSVNIRQEYDYGKREYVERDCGFIYGDRVKIPNFDPFKDSWFSNESIDKKNITVEPVKFSPFETHCHKVLNDVGYDWNSISNTDVESDNSWITKSHLTMSTFIFDYAGKQLRKKYGDSVKYTCDKGEWLFFYENGNFFETIVGHGCSWEVYFPDGQDITKCDMEKLVGETGIIELLEEAYQNTFEFTILKKTITPRKNRLGGRPEINIDKLTDMSGVEIEAGDIIAYPYSRGKYDYSLGYAVAKEFSGKFVVHENGKTCASKVLVIKTKNPEKILSFQSDGN